MDKYIRVKDWNEIRDLYLDESLFLMQMGGKFVKAHKFEVNLKTAYFKVNPSYKELTYEDIPIRVGYNTEQLWCDINTLMDNIRYLKDEIEKLDK